MPRIARFSLFFLLSATCPCLFAALPELSSIDPIEYDEEAGRLVARGDARIEFGDTRVTAERISYYRDLGLADAINGVEVTRQGYRLIADRLAYEAGTDVFSVNQLRTGRWPFYISGVQAGGTADAITIQGGTLYGGNPGPLTLNVTADSLEYVDPGGGASDYLKMEAATFRVGSFPVFYLPRYTHDLDRAPFLVDAGGGSDNELGTYLQTTTLFPVFSGLRLGANFDLYSKRGALAGPTAQYVYDETSQTIRGALTTGFIKDQGDPEEDLLGDPIGTDRGFAQWRHQHDIGERIEITADVNVWSDSEVTRDFREDLFDANRQPDSFAEAVYLGDNFILSAFARPEVNDFQRVQERLPELRAELLPTPVFQTGAYQQAWAGYSRLREDFGGVVPALADESRSDRFEFSYRVERPIHYQDWLTLTPLAGARLSHYADQESAFTTLPDAAFTQEIYEVGFDLTGRFHATYPTVNRTWGIDGLRHVLRPVLRYRYHSDPESSGEIAPIDRAVFNLERPVLDLSDIRDVDARTERHLARIGVENLYQTRAEGYGSRSLAALNFYQDILFQRDEQLDGDEEKTFNATWVELILNPAPWLKFDLASRFETESLTLEELRTRTRLVSGEIWEAGIATDLLLDRIDQYRLDFLYRVSERYSLLLDLRVDADEGEVSEFGLGLQSRIGNTWEIVYALVFREEARRESDVEFNIRLRLADIE